MSTVDLKEVEMKVKKTLSKFLNIDENQISLKQKLVEDLGLDSFASIELGFELTDQTGVDIPDKDFINLKTIEDVVVYIHSHLPSKDA